MSFKENLLCAYHYPCLEVVRPCHMCFRYCRDRPRPLIEVGGGPFSHSFLL